ncbi:MAG TPA: DUF429 domain-containing protein [Candidatus Acidoferrum sp.]|nr:DUF429 domain-containing protein [Candidatus Acidoferrum sp.]
MIKRVVGIDFSGAEKAGEAIWIAEAETGGDGVRIERCGPAADLAGSGPERARCLAALVIFIAAQRNAIIGCDFPFSLPVEFLDGASWRDFALGLEGRFSGAEDFLADCRRRSGGREIRRACDRESRVPFAAYNLRIYRQTYHGIRDVLAPLLRTDDAVVLPMEGSRPDRPWVIETCPASTLKQAGLYPSYKGRGDDARAARRHIVDGLVRRGILAPLSRSLRRLAIENQGGDVLDSMVAAAATARAYRSGAFRDIIPNRFELVEGRVYF